MAECIDRQAAIKKLDHFQSHLHTVEGAHAIGVAKTLIKEIPAADVRPVVRGAWIPGTDDKPFECSACHARYYWYTRKYASSFCPNCGADMRDKSHDRT